MAADDRMGQVEIFDPCLQPALELFRHLAPKDGGDLLGLSDVPIQVQQSLGEFVNGGTAMEDEVVAILHPGEEQAMSASCLLPFLAGDKRGEGRKPLLTTLRQIPSGERVGPFWQAGRVAAPQEGVAARAKADPLGSHPDRQPVMRIPTHPRGEGEIGAHPHEPPALVFVVEMEVEGIDPALFELQVRTVILLSADRHQDGGWLPRFQNPGHSAGGAVLPIGHNESVPPLLLGGLQDRRVPLLRSVLEPGGELIGDLGQRPAANPLACAVGIEEARHAAFEKGVHGHLQSGEIPGAYSRGRPPLFMPSLRPAARSFRDLRVWQKAREFVLTADAFTAGLPRQETYGLALQMRRAAVSIPANPAEGFRRRGKPEKARFMNIAEGSLEESRDYLIRAQDPGYADTTEPATALEEVSPLRNAYATVILSSRS